MTPAETRSASRRILSAARVIAARAGAGKITIDAVAKEAGLSKGGVLYNYPTKKALLSGLLDAMLAEHRELLESVPERHPARTLRGHLETVLQSQEVDDDLSMAILATAASDPAYPVRHTRPAGCHGGFLGDSGGALPETSQAARRRGGSPWSRHRKIKDPDR